MDTFGKRLKKLRKEKNLTQKDVAKALGVAQTTIANYEQDTRFPNQDTLIIFADYFHVTLDYLLCRNLLKSESCIKEPKQVVKNIEMIREDYMKFLIKGDTKKAHALIHDAVAHGVDVEKIYMEVFQKGLNMIGDLWEKDEMDIFNEHYVSNVTQNIMAQLSKYRVPSQKIKGSIVGVCASGEEHCIGLKMVMDFLEIDGWNTYFLGTHMPTKDIIKAIQSYKAKMVVLSATMPFCINGAENLIHAIRKTKAIKKVKILVGGNAFNQSQDMKFFEKIGANFYAHDAKETVSILKEHISS